MKSTDDVALLPFIKANRKLRETLLRDLEAYEKAAKILCEKIRGKGKCDEKSLVKSQKALFHTILLEALDIGQAASELNVSIDALRRAIKETVSELIRIQGWSTPKYAVEALEPVLEGLNDEGVINLVRSLAEKAPARVLSRLAEPTTSYVIVKADADNIGLLHQGRIREVDPSLTCREYSRAILDILRMKAVIRCSKGSDYVLSLIEEAFNSMCSLVEELYNATLPVSPSYKSALSAGLMIAAIKDLYTVIESGGVLVFSGGDDLLAIMPSVPPWKPLLFRLNYEGEAGFHKTGGLLAPAVPYGRSISVRLAELMDVMSVEIGEALRLLEEEAKEAHWILGECWRKDTILYSSSRSSSKALLPLTLRTNIRTPLAGHLASMIAAAHAFRLVGALSGTLPEDLEVNYGVLEAAPILARRPADLVRLVEHVVERNIDVPNDTLRDPVVDAFLGRSLFVSGRAVHKILSEIVLKQDCQGKPLTPALLEYVRLFRILRVIP